MGHKAFFVSITGTYLDNDQAYHAYEGVVLAPSEESAIGWAIADTDLRITGRTHEGRTRGGDYETLPVYENPDDNDAEIILDDRFAAPLATHLFDKILIVGMSTVRSGSSHPSVQAAIAWLESMAIATKPEQVETCNKCQGELGLRDLAQGACTECRAPIMPKEAK